MFDFGWMELLVIAAVGILVLGPAEIPAIMRTLGRIVRRVQYVRYAFTQQFEDFLREEDIRKSVNFEAPEYDEAAADDGFDYEPAEPVQPIEEQPKRVADDGRS